MQVKFAIFLFFLFLNQIAFAQQVALELSTEPIAKEDPSFFDYIVEDCITKITLLSDFTTIRENKKREEYYPAHLDCE